MAPQQLQQVEYYDPETTKMEKEKAPKSACITDMFLHPEQYSFRRDYIVINRKLG